jgi:hypothetical protein
MSKGAKHYELRFNDADLNMILAALNAKQASLYELLQEFEKEDPHFSLVDSHISLIESLKHRIAIAEEVRYLRAV